MPATPAFAGKDPDDPARAAIRKEIADLEADLPRHWLPGGAVAAPTGEGEWVPLTIESSVASGGGRFETLDDGSVFVAGPNPFADAYTLTIAAPPPRIAALRLEAIPDRRLAGGAGRGERGGFAIGEIRAFAVTGDGAGAKRTPIPFATAAADVAEPGQPAAAAIDGATRTGWSPGPGSAKRHELTLSCAAPFALPKGAALEVAIEHPPGRRANLGRFAVSAKTAPASAPKEPAPAANAATPMERAKLCDRAYSAWKEALKTAPWTVVKPIRATATPKSKPAIGKDKSVLFAEPDENDVDYEIEAMVRQPPIMAVRLEVLRDEELPGGGPGRGKPAAAGAWSVREFKLFRADGRPIRLAGARANVAGPDAGAELMIDADPATAWKPGGAPLPCYTAVFDLERPLGDGRPFKLTFKIATGPMGRGEAGAPVGKFRLSLGSHRLPPSANGLPAELEEPLHARNRSADFGRKLQRHFCLTAPELARAREKIEALRRRLADD